MSFIDSLKAMFAGKSATPAAKADTCCDHGDHGQQPKSDCCSDEKCCKDGAACSTDGCDCEHGAKSE